MISVTSNGLCLNCLFIHLENEVREFIEQKMFANPTKIFGLIPFHKRRTCWQPELTETACCNLPSCSSWKEWRRGLCLWLRSTPGGLSQKALWRTPPPCWSGLHWGKKAWWCRTKSATWRGGRTGRWAGWEPWCAGPQRRCTAHPTACELSQIWVSHSLPAEHSESLV